MAALMEAQAFDDAEEIDPGTFNVIMGMYENIGREMMITLVRRHIIWNNLRPDLKEDLAHLVQDIRRRICGIASAGSPSFSV